MKGPRVSSLVAVLILVAAACGGGDDESATTVEATASDTTTTATAPSADPTTTTAAPAEETTTTTEALPPPSGPPPDLPDTPVTAPLGEDPTQYYNTDPSKQFDAAELGFEPGTVTAKWYTAEGHWVVAFEGLDLNAIGPLCPGASIFNDGNFDFVSNAPSTGADCSNFPTLSEDPEVRALECNGLLSYRTAIPTNAAGNFLFGTIEKPTPEGFIIGMTSLSLTDPAAPAIDPATLSC